MGDAGRPRKALAVKERQGTVERSRESAREPEFPEGDLSAPGMLTGIARVEYERLAKLLQAQGLFPATAQSELAIGCYWFGVWAESAALINEHGTATVSDSGRIYANPAVAHAATATTHYMAICGRFGLDPASAGKVTAKPKTGPSQDELARRREERRAAR